MSKPFQFSIGQMLGGMTCLCVLAWALCLFESASYSQLAFGLLLLFIGCCSIGAVVGETTGRAITGVVVGSLCFLLLLLLFSLQLLLPPVH